MLSYARGFAPCIPGLNPRGTGSTCRCRRLNGGRAPGVAGSASVSGTRRGLAFFVARRPHLSLAFLPPSPPSPFPVGRGRPRLFHARGFAPCIPDIKLLAALVVPAVQEVHLWGGALSFSPANPAFRFDSAPHPPLPPSQWEGGDFRLFYARGFAPCIPGVEPAVRRKTDRISLP